MEYYAAIKENELLIHIYIIVTDWINFKGIMLNGKSQSQKITYYMILFLRHSQKDKIKEMENRLMLAGVGDGRDEEMDVAIRG